MTNGAEHLVSSGGPSAPAWAFFTAISLALIAIIPQLMGVKKDVKEARRQASIAATNSHPVSNGFTADVQRKLDHLTEVVDTLQEQQADHFRWHLNKERKSRGSEQHRVEGPQH